jgi:hypothetical protein
VKHRPSLRSFRAVRASLLCVFAAALSCGDSSTSGPVTPSATLLPGEVCDKDNRPTLALTFDPPSIVVAPGRTRPVHFVVEPDMCEPNRATFVAVDPNVVAGPKDAEFDLRHASYDFLVTGGAVGKTTISASMSSKDANGATYTVKVDLPVEVRDPKVPECSAGDVTKGTIAGGTPKLDGQGSLAGASLSSPEAAFTRTDEFALPAFPAELACAPDLTPAMPEAKLVKLGPAVTYTARAPLSMAKALRREVDVSIPVNPAAFPDNARLRHLVVLYQGPRVHTPRPIPIANPRVDAVGNGYVLSFSTPWLGTYQAAIPEDAGARVHTRHLTHRAVIGISMGGGGAGIFGMNHHDQFDVLAPLGGPSDWTWLLWYIENYHLGGFCPVGKTCTTTAPNRYVLDEPYAHTQDFDHWFYQKGGGNGGTFDRGSYVQIFEDLALAMGNPNGTNQDPGLSYMVPGPGKDSAWVTVQDAAAAGLPAGTDCSFAVDPIKNDPDQDKQRDIDAKCKAYRCAHPWISPSGYLDDEYNPDGSQQVISFCDGAQDGTSPYVNQFKTGGSMPMNVGLAVDLNKNGVRDPGEPIIRSGHEPYEDCGTDMLCDADEPGYDAENNPDPNQDDYDFQLNPSGLEGNHRYDPGEKFQDVGLDGLPNTKGVNPFDVGEGDGVYTESSGLTSFYANDPHAMLSGRSTPKGGPVTDDALRRLDILADGGIRDLFNFASVGSHFSGQIQARRGPTGLPLRSVAFYNGFQKLPGVNPDPLYFVPTDIRWADIADMPNIRYGDIDATQAMIDQGDGQHVGTVAQLLARLETTFFYVAKAWPDADRRQTEESRENPERATQNPALGQEQIDCEILGRCEHIFTGPASGRTGPIAVSLPPGYALQQNVDRNVRYPVMYVLHGYGQDPRDLEAVAIFTNNFMNVAQRSSATRLAKFIIVYVDGRCRVKDGHPECIRGTFYMNSARPDGAKMDDWFEEVTTFVDQTYRTMPATDVDVQE